jgi:cytidine deaminase
MAKLKLTEVAIPDNKTMDRLAKNVRQAVKESVPLELRGARYGACVLSTRGKIYRGGNMFSSTQSLSVHAEQAALIHAASHGDPLVRAIAIASDDPTTEPFPCGSCRQIIFENARHSKLDILVLCYQPRRGRPSVHKISELYPLPWPGRESARNHATH